jgi:hypothetical protein
MLVLTERTVQLVRVLSDVSQRIFEFLVVSRTHNFDVFVKI